MKLVEQLREGIFLLHGAVGGRPLHLPVLVSGDRAMLIDTGCASDVEKVVLPGLAEIGLPRNRLTWVLNSHCDVDHQGGNAGLKRAAPGLLFACGDADRAQVESPTEIIHQRYDAYRFDHALGCDEATMAWFRTELGAPQSIDLTLHGGERMHLAPDWEIEILHLPGHSRGHLGVWDKRHHILFGGDAIQGSGYLDLAGKPALCPTYLYVRPYLGTIQRIAALPLDSYVGCHWPVQRGGEAIRNFCAESRRFVEQAEDLILAAIVAAGARGLTLRDLCFSLGAQLGAWPPSTNHELRYAFAGHLTDLVERGVIRENRAARPFRFSK